MRWKLEITINEGCDAEEALIEAHQALEPIMEYPEEFDIAGSDTFEHHGHVVSMKLRPE